MGACVDVWVCGCMDMLRLCGWVDMWMVGYVGQCMVGCVCGCVDVGMCGCVYV